MNLMHLGAVALAASVSAGASAGFESATTVFGPSIDAGQIAPDASVLGALAEITGFGADSSANGPLPNTPNVGQTLFFQIGGFYVGGAGPATSNPLSDQGLENLGGPVVNNRAYGVIGPGRSDINFVPGLIETLTIQVRGSEAGMTTGTNPGTNFGGVPTDLLDAGGTVLIWTELGIEATLDVSNTGYSTFTLDTSNFLGDSITRISLLNEGPAQSVVALGELTATLIPAPGAVGVAGLSLLGAAGRRRR